MQRRIGLIWFGMPCTSWSRARRLGDNGPPPLRDDNENLYGFTESLSDKDYCKIKQGSELMRYTYLTVLKLEKMKIP